MSGSGTHLRTVGKDDDFWDVMPCSVLFYPSFEMSVPVCDTGRHIPEEPDLSVIKVETGFDKRAEGIVMVQCLYHVERLRYIFRGGEGGLASTMIPPTSYLSLM